MIKKTKIQNDNLNRLTEGLWTISTIIFEISYYGIKRLEHKSYEFFVLTTTVTVWLYVISILKDKINFKINLGHEFLTNMAQLIFKFETQDCFIILLSVYILGLLFFLGVKTYKKKREYQNNLDTIGLKNAIGIKAKVVKVVEVDEFKEKILVKGKGIGIDRYIAKKNDLENAFSETITEFRDLKSKNLIEIVTNSKVLSRLIPFSGLVENIKKPYSFLAGESLKGPVCVSLKELPHLLIAGTTGGGKSICFRQILLSLLKTKNLQLYLLDLKKGVEVKEFGVLPNVQIAKDEIESINLLQAINEEMERRFIYLEKIGRKIIEPKRDKMDLIIIGVDEASELYGVPKSNKKAKEMIFKARELTDKIAKLGRAAGIHLILATQKVLKETIDTKVQENIGGRICFRMNTSNNSINVLGNNKAYNLPDIKGRAIWANGNNFTTVQVPFINEEEVKEELEIIESKIENEAKWNFQKMIKVKKEARKKDDDDYTKMIKKKKNDKTNTD